MTLTAANRRFVLEGDVFVTVGAPAFAGNPMGTSLIAALSSEPCGTDGP